MDHWEVTIRITRSGGAFCIGRSLGRWCWVIAKLVGLGCFCESGFIGISTAERGGGQEASDHLEAVTMTSPALSIDQRVREADLEKKENRE